MRRLYLVAAAVILTVAHAAPIDEHFELLLLHTNDMHSRFEETAKNSGTCRTLTTAGGKKCVGGFARVAHAVDEYRREAATGRGRPVLFLNAGDTYTGTPWFGVHKARICTEMLNALKPDVVTIGNHEFDYGVSGLLPFASKLEMPLISANLNLSNEADLMPYVKPSVVLTIGARRVGVIGYLTPDTKFLAQTDEVIFEDEVKALRRESERLDADGVDIIIALGHSGFLMDKLVAEQVPLVDVVIGGHTNTFLWNGPQPDSEKAEGPYPWVVVQASGKKVPVVQAYAYTKYLGRLNVTFDGKGDLVEFSGQPLYLDNSVPQDPGILNLLEPYRQKVLDLDNLVVGQSRVTLDSEKCRRMECNFGNLVADGYVDYATFSGMTQRWSYAPIALVNGGCIRNTIDPVGLQGNVTRSELLGALPFDGQVITLSLKGKDLLETLEIGVRSDGETSYGEFLQVSGLQVMYDMSRPKYQRVVSVVARCGACDVPQYNSIDPDAIYNVTTNGFLANGGDGHHVLKERGFNLITQDLHDIDAIEWYMKRRSPVYPNIEGRIRFVSAHNSGTRHHSHWWSIYVTTILIGCSNLVVQ